MNTVSQKKSSHGFSTVDVCFNHNSRLIFVLLFVSPFGWGVKIRIFSDFPHQQKIPAQLPRCCLYASIVQSFGQTKLECQQFFTRPEKEANVVQVMENMVLVVESLVKTGLKKIMEEAPRAKNLSFCKLRGHSWGLITPFPNHTYPRFISQTPPSS